MTGDYDGPERRKYTLHNLWRDLVPFVALCLAGWSLLSVQARSEQVAGLTRENTSRISDIARLTQENQDATEALCALRADLRRRVRTSQQFLREHPRGIPGIPAKTIRSGIRNQQRTIAALSDLSC